MRRRRRTVSVAVGAMVLVACSSGDDPGPDADSDGEVQIPTVTVPPERLTPFCAAMIDLADELERNPPDDTSELILETYLEIVDDVPPAIAEEFRAVIAELQGGSPTTPPTTAPTTVDSGVATSAPLEDFDAEGRLPGESPGERVNDYVRFACRDSDNNPGPPATQPLDDIELDDEN